MSHIKVIAPSTSSAHLGLPTSSLTGRKADRFNFSTKKIVTVALLIGAVITAALAFMAWSGIYLPYTTGGAYFVGSAVGLSIFAIGVVSLYRKREIDINKAKIYQFAGCHSYNLCNNGEIAPHSFHPALLQLPICGVYNQRRGYDTPSHCLGVRLPQSYLERFPITFSPNEKVEAFFLVFKDQKQSEESFARNIVMHAMAFPDYDMAKPEAILDQTALFEVKSEIQTSNNPKTYQEVLIESGVQASMQIGIADPHGIEPYSVEKRRAIPFGEMGMQPLQIHGKSNKFPSLSPDYAKFMIKKDAIGCSFYVVAKFRGNTVAFHAIIARNTSLDEALKTKSLPDFLTKVATSNFPYRSKILQTFSVPSKSKSSSHE